MIKKSKLIILAIFLVVIVAIILYFFFTKTPEQSFNKNDILDLTFEVLEDRVRVPVKYTILVNNRSYAQGTTLEQGLVQEKVPFNTTVQFFIESIDGSEDQEYYSILSEIFRTAENRSYRKTLQIERPGVLRVVKVKGTPFNFNFSNFSNNRVNKINVTLFADGSVRDLILCSQWSFSVLNIEQEQSIDINEPEGYKLYDKCQEIGLSLKDETVSFNVSVELFKSSEPNDYINITFIDREPTITPTMRLSNVDQDKKDIGAKDVTIMLIP